METFLAVCQHMNYTKAAAALRITQPAVSQHIRQIEEHYGQPMFKAEGKRMILTKAGLLLQQAAATMRHDEALLRKQMMSGEKETLVFGATRTIGDFVLPDKLSRFIAKNPTIEMRVIVDNTESLLRQIDNGVIDFALIEGYYPQTEYDHQLIGTERFIAVCSFAHCFKAAPKRMHDLLDECILLREPGSGSREIFERRIEEGGLSLRDFGNVIEIGSIHVIKALAAQGRGITFLYEAAAAQELADKTLSVIELQDFQVSHSFTAVWRKNFSYRSVIACCSQQCWNEMKKLRFRSFIGWCIDKQPTFIYLPIPALAQAETLCCPACRGTRNTADTKIP